jgi:hypothetical protein
VIASEVHANAYGNGGRIGAAISITARLYRDDFNQLKPWMPGFDTLAPLDCYKYLSIMAATHSDPTVALMYESESLISAFPQLEEVITVGSQRAMRYHDVGGTW